MTPQLLGHHINGKDVMLITKEEQKALSGKCVALVLDQTHELWGPFDSPEAALEWSKTARRR